MVVFGQNWRQWQQFPFNEKRVRAILQTDLNVPGTIRAAALSDNREVRVVAGVHAGGAPGARADSRMHITISFERQSYHVQLAANGGVYRVTN